MFFALCASKAEAQGLSFRNLNACSMDYSEVFMDEEVKKIDDLPSGIYLARSVTQSLEKQNEKYISYQKMTSASDRKQDLCFTGAPSAVLKTQALIPTVIDQSKAKQIGNTFWNLSANLDKSTGAVQFTRSLVPNTDYKSALQAQGFKITSIQQSHDVFKLRLERIVSPWKEVVVIHFDQF